jgi:hypothetical protein
MSAEKPAKREWTEDEISQLRRFASQKMGQAIAKTLGRSTGSVRQKAFWLDISLRSG